MRRLEYLKLNAADYIEGARLRLDMDTVDGILTKQQHGHNLYWQKTFGCTPFEIDVSVMMAYLNGQTVQQIADRMGVTVGTVYQRLRRAMHKVEYYDRFLQDGWEAITYLSVPEPAMMINSKPGTPRVPYGRLR